MFWLIHVGKLCFLRSISHVACRPLPVEIRTTKKKNSATFEVEHEKSYVNAPVRQNFLRQVGVAANSVASKVE